MRNRELLAAAVIVVAVVVAYVPAMRGGFVWDDDQHVVQDHELASLRGLGRIWFVPGTVPQYYPLVHTTFWIENRLWGLRPFGYHLVNVLLHATVALIFWSLLRKLRVPGGWLAAAIFALHPVHVESVAWITERKNVLSGLFYLLATHEYLRYDPLDGERRGALRHYLAAALLFLCALLSKTVTATLPAVLILLRGWKRGRITRGDVIPLVPFFAMGLALSAGTVWMERHHVGAEGEAWDLSPLQRLIIAGRALFFYLSKLVFPAKLTFIYPRWSIAPHVTAQLVYPVAACALIVILWLSRRRIGREPVIALLFFAGTLLPALGFFNVFPMRYSFVADHFQYLASMGPIALAAGLMTRARQGASMSGAGRARRGGWGAAALVLLFVLGTATWMRAGVFRNAETLWADTIAKNPRSWMAQHNLGLVYENEGRLDEAIAQYRKAIAIDPNLETSHYNLATALAKQGNLDEARKSYEDAVRIRPDYTNAWNNLGTVLATQGKLAEAVVRFRRALACDAGNLSARKNLAYALGGLGQARESIAEYREAMRLDPDDPEVLSNLAWLLATTADPSVDRGADAVRYAERACVLTRNRDAACLRILATAYRRVGRLSEAAAADSLASFLTRARLER